MYSACIHDSITTTDHIPAVEQLVRRHLHEGTFPGVVIAVRSRGSAVYRLSAGHRALDPHPLELTLNTPFDLASLTKPLATAVMVLRAVEEHGLSLRTRLGDLLALEDPAVADTTILQLLTHTSGLPPSIEIPAAFPDARMIDGDRSRQILRSVGLERPPGEEVVYSCTGYLLLGLAVEALNGSSLRGVWDTLSRKIPGLAGPRFPCLDRPIQDAAITEYCPWRGEWIRGVVHDETSYCLGGDGGNAGLFGTAEGVLSLLDILRSGGLVGDSRVLSSDSVGLMTSCQSAPLSPYRSAAYLMQGPGFPFGSVFGRGSFGHTGFTGTSVAVDPDAELEMVVLTNRVHLGREHTAKKIVRFRREIHLLLHRLFAR